MVKSNKGLTLIEVILVLTLMGGVMIFFWNVLDSSTKDSSTITEKIEVQNSVTALMNIIQGDIQGARPGIDKYGEKSIFYDVDGGIYLVNSFDGFIRYEFDEENMKVRRITKLENDGTILDSSEIGEYNFIKEFNMTLNSEKTGADIKIVGSKNKDSAVDKTRYELNTSYYTRNTR